MIATSHIHAAVEALMLASPEPLPVNKICDVIDRPDAVKSGTGGGRT